MEKEVFILYSCDEWKSYSSMNMIGIYSSITTLIKQLKILRDEKQLGNYKDCNINLNNENITLYDLRNLQFVFIETKELDIFYSQKK